MRFFSLIVVSCALMLTSCSFDITKDDVDRVKDIFAEQVDKLYNLYETSGKEILSDLSIDKAEDMLNDLLAKIPEDKKELVYEGINKGVSLLEDGKEILVNELSMNVSLEGVQEEIEAFLESLSGLDARISVDNLKIEKTEDNYKLDCTINFFYSSGK